MKTCSVDLCDKSHEAQGYCTKHYQRFRRRGTLKLDRLPKPLSKPSLSLQRVRQSKISEAFFQARKIVKPYRASLEF